MPDHTDPVSDSPTPADPTANTDPKTIDNVQLTGAYDQDLLLIDRIPTARAVPVIAGYKIVRELGRGGMGAVFLAHDTKLNRSVAIKTIVSGAFATDAELRRFRTEAEAVARISHPHIVQVHDAGATQEGLPYLVMEYCGGGALNGRVKGTPLAAAEAANLLLALTQGIAAAHAVGVIHRDLKPGNILLAESASLLTESSRLSDSKTPLIPSRLFPKPADGSSANRSATTVTAKIADFGLAKLMDTGDGKTRTGAVMGTPSYMAPEQAFGETKNVGPLADVYSLGSILYELLVGRPPFRGATDADTLDQVRYREPVPPRMLANVPKDLDTICLKCLQKDPAKRYASALALAEDLNRFSNKLPILARPIGPLGRSARWVRRNPGVATLAGIALGLLIAVAVTATIAALSLRAKNHEIEQSDLSLQAKNREIEQSLNRERTAREQAQIERELAAGEADRNQRLVKFVLWDVASRLKDNNLREAILQRTLAEVERQASNETESGRFADRGRMSIDLQLGEMYLAKARSDVGAQRQKSFTAASQHLKKAAETAQKLLELEPDSAQAKGNLAVIRGSLGKMYLDAKLFDKAREEYQLSQQLRQEVVDHPGPPGGPNSLRLGDVRASLANSYGAQADLARVQKDSAAASELLNKAIALVREGIKLVEANPANTEHSDGIRIFRSDLARYLLVAVREKAGDKSPEGLRFVNAQLAETEKLLAGTTAPDDLDGQRELARLLAQAGDNYLFAATDPQSAKNLYERSLAILEQIRKRLDAREIQSDVAMGHYRLGTALLRLKDFGLATHEYRESLAIREQHFMELPTERARLTLMTVLARAGEVQRAARMVEELRPIAQMKDEFPFDAACTYAICAWVAGNWRPDAELTPEQQRQRKEFIAKALADVQAVIKAGSSFADQLATDPDLEFLQGNAEFQAMLRARKK